MPCMNDQHIARLEAQLERLVEGTFSQLFGKKIRAQDIAMQLARAMEDGAEGQNNGDSRMLAPDHYTIYLHSQVRTQLIERQPLLPNRLSQLGPGVSWHDLDGDGWDDLFVTSGRGGVAIVTVALIVVLFSERSKKRAATV